VYEPGRACKNSAHQIAHTAVHVRVCSYSLGEIDYILFIQFVGVVSCPERNGHL